MYERSIALEETLSEIDAKQAQGVALLPTPKDHRVMAEAQATNNNADATQTETTKTPDETEQPVDFNTPLELEVEGEAGV